MTETDTPAEIPCRRLSADSDSPFHDAAAMERGVGIRFNGQEKTNVEEYCVSEGWVRGGGGHDARPAWQAADAEAQGHRRALLARPRMTACRASDTTPLSRRTRASL